MNIMKVTLLNGLTKANLRLFCSKTTEEGGLDLVITPGLAFTLNGGRMGRGKGYYDRFLVKCKSKNPKLSTIAVAFNEQIVTDLPIGERDFILDGVVTSESEL